MKRATGWIAVILAVALYGPAAGAQSAPTTTGPVAPLQLKPASNAPITLHLADDSKIVYQAIGKAAGIEVLFDPSYISKHISVDLNDVSLSDALRIVGELSGAFYKPFTSNSILVATDNHTKHTELDDMVVHTFYMTNTAAQSDANEIVTALRNILPADDKIYLVASRDAIVMRAPADQIALAQAIVHDLDLPKKSYRLTYTVSEKDGGKLVGTEHYTVVAASGQTMTLKQRKKVPLETGSYTAVAGEKTPAGAETQMSYIDVGMDFDATLTATGDGAVLKSDVAQSSVAPERSGVGPQDPIVQQTELRNISYLSPGKPLALGTLDIPGGTRHLEIEVTMEPLP